MKRKLIKQGGSGLTLYIPKNWLDERGLKPGDEVNVDESGDYLLVSAEVKKENTIVLNLDGHELESDVYIPALTHVYRLGYDKIEVNSNNSKIIHAIEENVIPLLIGFEIVTKDKNLIVLENISEPSDDKFLTMLRRIFLIIDEMGEQVVCKIENPRFKSRMPELKKQIHKLCIFCKRNLTKKIHTTHNPLVYWEMITYLLAIGHAYHYLYEYLRKNQKKMKIGGGIKDYLTATNEYFDMLYDAHYEKKTDKIFLMNKTKKKIVFTWPENLLEEGKENAVMVSKLSYIARITGLCSGSVYYAIVD